MKGIKGNKREMGGWEGNRGKYVSDDKTWGRRRQRSKW
jgi:hypothetical protein